MAQVDDKSQHNNPNPSVGDDTQKSPSPLSRGKDAVKMPQDPHDDAAALREVVELLGEMHPTLGENEKYKGVRQKLGLEEMKPAEGA